MAIGGKKEKRAAYVRLAGKEDVPMIKLLIEGLAEFEKLSDECHATEAKLLSTLFRQPAFLGPTVFMLELGPAVSSSTPHDQQRAGEDNDESFQEQYLEVSIDADVVDEASISTFRSSKDEARTVAGFVLFFPNYSTFLAKSGLYIEDLYVRGCYRRQGLGTVLLKTVAQQAARRGYGRVEWSVLDWNVNAIKFYEGMGAIVQQEWRICRLTGDALKAYGN